jgi:hypothetical protein
LKIAKKVLNWEESKKEYFLRKCYKQMQINWNRPKPEPKKIEKTKKCMERMATDKEIKM